MGFLSRARSIPSARLRARDKNPMLHGTASPRLSKRVFFPSLARLEPGNSLMKTSLSFIVLFALLASASAQLKYPGKDGPGKGKHIVAAIIEGNNDMNFANDITALDNMQGSVMSNLMLLAVGTTRTSADYAVGINNFAFLDGSTPLINVPVGASIAVGFLDANADGTGGGSAGAGISGPMAYVNATGDDLFYSGGPANDGSDSADVHTGDVRTGTRVIADLTNGRSYQFNIEVSLIPEPSSAGLLLGGMLLLAARLRRGR